MGYLSPGVAVYPGATDGDLLVVEQQEIPTDWVREWRRQNERSRFDRRTETRRVGTIPMIFVSKWMREGLNVFTAPMKDIVKKVYEEGLDDFLVKNGRSI